MSNLQNKLAEIQQGSIQPIYLVQGSEQFLVDRVKNTLVKAVFDNEDDVDLNFIMYNMKETTIDMVVQEAESFPFFGDKRLIFIQEPYFFTGERFKNAPDHDLKALENYLENPSDFSVVVFFAPYEKLDKRKKITKKLQKNAEFLDVQPMKERELTNYIKTVSKERGYRFKDDSFELLLNRTDYDLTKLMSELEKLFIYHSEDKLITVSTVNELVSKSLEHNVFEINDLVLNQEANKAVEVFQDLILQKEEPIKIMAIMMSQFRLLLQVKILRAKGYQQNDISSVLKTHPYRVKLALQKEKQFSQQLLSKAYRQLIDADYKIKSGQVKAELQFELFVMKFSKTKINV